MPWQTKEQPSPLDTAQIPGLEFLHGEVMATRYRQEWTRGQKYPLLTFPSGITREVLTPPSAGAVPSVHIFGALSLPYSLTRDEAYTAAETAGADYGYEVAKDGATGLVIVNPDAGRRYRLTFDNTARQLVDIEHFPKHAVELLPGELRAALPQLYATEKLGDKAIVPIKFFTPDGGWSWFPTEFDGKDIFFGLVAGFEVEIGYFSLTELESIRGGLGLPIERDLYFSPTPLSKVRQMYSR